MPNPGMFGITSFASIVNEPQGAIMSVGAGGERVVVKDGKMEIATVMTVTRWGLSFLGRLSPSSRNRR